MTTSPWIFAVESGDFPVRVLQKSNDVPVLVDFWADWCQPCHMLAPVLESVAAYYDGRLLVAKVDTETNPDVAAEYGVRSLPTLKLFKRGSAVTELVGVQPAEAIVAAVGRFVESAADERVREGEALLVAGRPADAAAVFEEVSASDPEHPGARLGLAAARLGAGDADAAEALLKALPANVQETDAARILQDRIGFVRAVEKAPDRPTLERAIADRPDDTAARYALGARLVLDGDYAAAQDQFLEIMRRDRAFQDDAGRRGLVAVFNILGPDDPQVQEYRRKMAALLY